MADDTPTVEHLRQRVIDAYGVHDCTMAELRTHLDALIAAVRAENAQKIAALTHTIAIAQGKLVG